MSHLNCAHTEKTDVTDLRLEQRDDYWLGGFQAMGCPCELLVDTRDRALAEDITYTAREEALRIERKFSRYRDDNIIHDIHHSDGNPVTVDAETAKLLDYADLCFRLSNGKFDVTSGVLRQVWKFDGSDRIPTKEHIATVLPHIGWNKVTWKNPHLTLPAGMEIDLGGIGKEYAVDKTAQTLAVKDTTSTVVNFGGDLFVSGPRADGTLWRIGLDDPDASGARSVAQLQLARGGIATSGDTRRFLLKNGVRYGHILNPKTGWPVRDAPHSVTAIANSCVEAGMLATFAILEGANAEDFLKTQGVRYFCFR